MFDFDVVTGPSSIVMPEQPAEAARQAASADLKASTQPATGEQVEHQADSSDRRAGR